MCPLLLLALGALASNFFSPRLTITTTSTTSFFPPPPQVHEADPDFDGRPDSLSLHVQVPLNPGDSVASVSLLLGFSYELRVC